MVRVRQVTYEADGRVLVGTLAVPDTGGPHPGVLIASGSPSTSQRSTGTGSPPSDTASVPPSPWRSRAPVPTTRPPAARAWQAMLGLFDEVF